LFVLVSGFPESAGP